MKRLVVFIGITLCLTLSLSAVTQEGYVKTIARKGKPGVPVEGTVIRVRGSHNAVESRQNGDFSLLLAALQNGEPYTIASIYKAGYEPAEQELIGRKLPCSNIVPLEILLVNSAELRAEKEAIARKARENVERYYLSQYERLEQQLQDARLTQQEFAQRVEQLEVLYERFEPLLQNMSDKLARTDYNRLDSLTLLIQNAIEEGNPQEAERLVREKGDLEARETAIREQEQRMAQEQHRLDEAAAQLDEQRARHDRDKRELADDYYRLYAAFLARFLNDSADFYIRKRAALDTLDIDCQLQAGQFVRDIRNDKEAAQTYFDRAYRLAQKQYGEMSGQMATTCSELGLLAKQRNDGDNALYWYQRSLAIRINVRGKNAPAVAEVLNNMGELYSAQKDYKQAMKMHQRARKINEKTYGPHSLQTAVNINNIGGVCFKTGDYNQARRLFEQVRAIYEETSDVAPRLIAHNDTNLGGVWFKTGDYDKAIDAFTRAYQGYLRTLGPNHPWTRNAYRLMQLTDRKLHNSK